MIRNVTLFVLLCIFLSACSSKDVTETGTRTITVPVILFLTGNQAASGAEIQQAFTIATEHFEQNHPSVRVKLLIEDSGDDAAKGLTAYQQLKSTGDYPLFISTGDAVTSALLPATEQDNKILVATTVSAPETNGPLMFRGFVTSSLQGDQLGKYIKSQNRTRIALLTLNNPFSISFLKLLKENVGEQLIIAEEQYNIVDMDARTQLLKIKDAKPDSIVIGGFGPTYPLIFKQIRDMEISAALYTHDAIEIPYYFSTAGGYETLDGLVYASTAFDLSDPPSDSMKTFIQEYSLRFNDRPSLIAGFAYDTLTLSLQALESCPSQEVAMLASCLGKQKASGLLGETAFDSERQLLVPTFIKQYTHNQTKILQSFSTASN